MEMWQKKKKMEYPDSIVRNGRAEAGFTLVELLVSVGVLIVLGGATYAAFKSSIDVYFEAESRLLMAQKCRVGLAFISNDLSNMYAIQEDELLSLISQDNPTEMGARDVISFVTLINTDPDPFLAQLNQARETTIVEQAPLVSDVQRVAYYVGPNLKKQSNNKTTRSKIPTGIESNHEHFVLSRINTTSIDPETVIVPLFDTNTLPTQDNDGNPIFVNVAQIIDGVTSFELRYSDGEEWYESWDDSETIPKSIQITITVSAETRSQKHPNSETGTMTQSTMVYLSASKNFSEQSTSGPQG